MLHNRNGSMQGFHFLSCEVFKFLKLLLFIQLKENSLTMNEKMRNKAKRPICKIVDNKLSKSSEIQSNFMPYHQSYENGVVLLYSSQT